MPDVTRQELEAGLPEILRSPAQDGVLVQIVRRPRVGHRELIDSGELNEQEGLGGDTWRARGPSPHPDVQLTVMNSRVIALISPDESRRSLAGDQLFVDFDLSLANLPPGSRLAVGAAIVEISAEPHTGCSKFVSRFGLDAMKFVNSPTGRALRLRGAHARVVQAGAIHVGDRVRKLGLPQR
jgi:MOSC domain-containing protein YiiM